MDNQSLAHSRYNCTYNIVFIPKYRRKVMFGKLRKDVGEILGKVCKMEGVTILKAATLPEHVHMYVSIPPKLNVSKTIGRIRGKTAFRRKCNMPWKGKHKPPAELVVLT